MNKAIIILALLVVAVAYTEAMGKRCRSMCHKNQPSPIRCVKDSPKRCRKMRQCEIDTENCKRRLRQQPHITSTSLGYCQHIKGSSGSGKCAGRKRRNSNCSQMPCTDTSPVLRCYRCKNNYCQWLTACQFSRINCHHGWNMAITYTDFRQCSGIKPGQNLNVVQAQEGVS